MKKKDGVSFFLIVISGLTKVCSLLVYITKKQYLLSHKP